MAGGISPFALCGAGSLLAALTFHPAPTPAVWLIGIRGAAAFFVCLGLVLALTTIRSARLRPGASRATGRTPALVSAPGRFAIYQPDEDPYSPGRLALVREL